MVVLNGGKPPDARPDVDPYSICIRLINLKTGIGKCHLAGRHGVLNEEIHLFDVFFVDVVGRVELSDFTGNLAIMGRRIESADTVNSGTSLAHRLPGRFHTDAQRRNGP